MTVFVGLFSFYSNIGKERKKKIKVVPIFGINFKILSLPNDYKTDVGEAKRC